MANDVKVAGLWDAVKARLGTAQMNNLLGGAGRIYHVTEDFAEAEDSELLPWGRVVLVPGTTLWPIVEFAGGTRQIQFMVRAEVNNFGQPGWSPLRMLEGVHDEAYGLLQWWVPEGVTDFQTVVHVYRASPPQALPMWDEGRNLWMLSANYRTEAAAAEVTP